ncbi:HEAT repeat domain-containing protein [Tenacibaculum halocynthiae]|uniref:HEAT repeat domain-containing protein n=1 Tax=Tenacibaculum halocynthiae TaxID=1254437 RepID=UPI003894A10E
MNCNDVQNQLINYIDNKLSNEEHLKIETHIRVCDNCTNELKKLEDILLIISNDEIEKPGETLKLNFENFLAKEIKEANTKVISLKSKPDWKSYIKIAASILIVLSAFLIGRQSNQQKTSIASQQKTQQKQQFFALLDNQSASKRILGVTNSKKFSENNIEIIEAIVNKLFYDKNVNVRLAAAEALSKFSSLELVKTALIKALQTEKEAIIQIELIQILAKIQEKRALEPMKKLLENEETPNYVKQELQYNIPSLL